MSSIRGGPSRGRGRGTSNATSSTSHAPSSVHRSGGLSSTRARGTTAPRGAFAQTPRGQHATAFRGREGMRYNLQGQNPQGTTQASVMAKKTGANGSMTKPEIEERLEQLTKFRKEEKEHAIANKLMTDPDKQIRVSEAITIVGTCQDMCPELERVQRIRHDEVMDAEKDEQGRVDEARMVKIFKRSEAGAEAQLPSDLRPPEVLRRTCDYLFNDILANKPLADVHHFVWDRTRGIRNDFSIQQLTKLDDLRIAIDCYERIARFHIVSLHQLALHEKPYPEYAAQQEREQLDRTLLSLMQYYDDTRGRIESPNEAEFKAYSIIFQLRDPIPDLENRVQSWPRNITSDTRVYTALEIYASACSIKYPAGPDSPVPPVIARQDWESFWMLINSRKVSYLQACVSEVYFMLVREMVLSALLRSSRVGKLNGVLQPVTDWTVDELWNLFNFDTEDDLRAFFSRWGLEFKQLPDSDQEYLDIKDLAGRPLTSGKMGPNQLKSSLVEDKRHGRTLSAVINGLSVRQARDNGLVEEEEHIGGIGDDVMDDVAEESKENEEDEESASDEDELFVRDRAAEKQVTKQQPVFPNDSRGAATAGFGKASPFNPPQYSGFGAPSQTNPINPSVPKSDHNSQVENGAEKKQLFNFLTPQPPVVPKPATSAASLFTNPATTAADQSDKPLSSFLNQSSLTDSHSQTTPTNAASPKEPSWKPSGTSPGSLFAPKKEPAQSRQGPFDIQPSPATSSSGMLEGASKAEAPFTFANPLAPSLSDPKATAVGAGVPSTQLQPETNLKSQQQQSLQQTQPTTTTPLSSSQNTQNATLTNSGSQSPTRRPSIFQDTKPKKPSPLANSFTANEESAPHRASQHDAHPTEQLGPPRELFLSKQAVPSNPSEQQKKPASASGFAPPAPSFEATTARLATELFLCERNGILKQYLEHHLKHAVAEAQEKVLEERIQARLALLRDVTIRRKWFQVWIVNASKRRAHRNRRRQKERRERKLAGGQDFDSSARSTNRGVGRRKLVSTDNRRQMVDSLFQMTSEKNLAVNSLQATAGSKRTASGHGVDTHIGGQGHKRFKSMDHVDDRGRVSRYASATDPNAEMLKRASFLGFSLPPDAPNRTSTTRSTYFRLKALGLKDHHHTGYASQLRSIKRPRSESLDFGESGTSASRSRSQSLLRSTPEQARDATMRPPSSTRSVSRLNDEDDALFARLRAAREALKDGETFMKDEVVKEEELRRSLSHSLSSNESPSMARARAEARLRASKGSSDFAASGRTRDVPAYRLRTSRFLSREEQACAVEKAHEMRALRTSVSSSRPEPTSELQHGASLTVVGKAQRPQPDVSQESLRYEPLQFPSGHNANGISDFASKPAANSLEQSQLSSSTMQVSSTQSNTMDHSFGSVATQLAVQQPAHASAPRNPFSQSSSFTPPIPTQNPFLHNAKPLKTQEMTSPTSIVQDHTIAPSQIDNALTQTFGEHAPAPSLSGQGTSRGSGTPPQPNSYLPSQAASEAVSLLSDDEGGQLESIGGPYGQAEYFASVEGAIGETDIRERSAAHSLRQGREAELLQSPYSFAHANSFTALDNQQDFGEDDDDGQPWSQNEVSEEEDNLRAEAQRHEDEGNDSEDDCDEDEDDGAAGNSRDGHLATDDSEIEDDDQSNGVANGHYYEDDEEADADEEDYSDDYDDEEEDDGDSQAPFGSIHHAYNRMSQVSQPVKNPALQGVGSTEEEAIELSD